MRSTHRSNYKKGDWLVVDQRTGATHYASNMVREADSGLWVHKDDADPRHPLLRLRPKYRDPAPLSGPIVPAPSTAIGQEGLIVEAFIGDTTRQRRFSPADHVFASGIGEMIIEGNPAINPYTVFIVEATSKPFFPSAQDFP